MATELNDIVPQNTAYTATEDASDDSKISSLVSGLVWVS